MRINLLSLLKNIVKIAAQVAAVGELVLAATQQQQQERSTALDLDAVRQQPAKPENGQQEGSQGETGTPPAAYPADPSAAH